MNDTSPPRRSACSPQVDRSASGGLASTSRARAHVTFSSDRPSQPPPWLEPSSAGKPASFRQSSNIKRISYRVCSLYGLPPPPVLKSERSLPTVWGRGSCALPPEESYQDEIYDDTAMNMLFPTSKAPEAPVHEPLVVHGPRTREEAEKGIGVQAGPAEPRAALLQEGSRNARQDSQAVQRAYILDLERQRNDSASKMNEVLKQLHAASNEAESYKRQVQELQAELASLRSK